MYLLTLAMCFASRITWWLYPYSLSNHTYSTAVSLSVIVALLSKIAGAAVPMISEDTNSLDIVYWICSTKCPSKELYFIMALSASRVVSVLSCRFKTTNDPLGTGTRMALDVNLPSNAGSAFATAFPAPVSVMTMLRAAALPLWYFLCMLSTKF